jgi:hypothetical protein
MDMLDIRFKHITHVGLDEITRLLVSAQLKYDLLAV